MGKKTKHFTLLIFLIYFTAVGMDFTRAESVSAPGDRESASGYERGVEMVILKNTTPEKMQKILTAIGRSWGLFPSLEVLLLQEPELDKTVLFLRGYVEEVSQAGEIATALDEIYPSALPERNVFAVPLLHLRAPAMKKKLLEVARSAGLGWRERQFVIYPPGPRGSLFFLGTAAEAKKVKEVKEELDKTYYGSFTDLLVSYWRAFRQDLSSHFITVSTYLASVLLLLALHFIIIRIPWLGKRYEQCFTLIWTKLLHGVKGRDFIYELIKNIVQTAVEAVEQSTAEAGGERLAAPGAGGKKARARAIIRDLLAYRGVDPDDPGIKKIVEELIEARVYELQREKRRSEFRKNQH